MLFLVVLLGIHYFSTPVKQHPVMPKTRRGMIHRNGVEEKLSLLESWDRLPPHEDWETSLSRSCPAHINIINLFILVFGSAIAGEKGFPAGLLLHSQSSGLSFVPFRFSFCFSLLFNHLLFPCSSTRSSLVSPPPSR